MEILSAACLAILWVGQTGWTAEPAPQAKPQITALYVEEISKPKDAPERGQTAWDLFERATYELHKARVMIEDTKAQTRTKNLLKDMDVLDKHLSQIERIQRKTLWPAMAAISQAHLDVRNVGSYIHVALQDRELFAQLSDQGSAYNGPLTRPGKDSIKVLQNWRERAFRDSVQAEEILDKGLKELRSQHDELPRDNYITDLLLDAERTLSQSAERSAQAMKGFEGLTGKPGPYWEAIKAAGAYGGLDGKGPFTEEERSKAVLLSNNANQRFVSIEYQIAFRLEELRTLPYLLERFGKL